MLHDLTNPAAGVLRRATLHDAASLSAFAASTFQETFAHSTSAQDMAEHLATHYGERQQAQEIGDPRCVTLVVEQDHTLVAFAQVRLADAPDCVRQPDACELRRFYVDRSLHGRGVAARLMAACTTAAVELGGRALWLSVWEHNHRALAFYGKMRFVDVGSAAFSVGTDRQTDRIMVLKVAT